MLYDPKFKERARAEDALDRLRDVRDRLQHEHEASATLHDRIIRGLLLVGIAGLVAYAYLQLGT